FFNHVGRRKGGKAIKRPALGQRCEFCSLYFGLEPALGTGSRVLFVGRGKTCGAVGSPAVISTVSGRCSTIYNEVPWSMRTSRPRANRTVARPTTPPSHAPIPAPRNPPP